MLENVFSIPLFLQIPIFGLQLALILYQIDTVSYHVRIPIQSPLFERQILKRHSLSTKFPHTFAAIHQFDVDFDH